MAQAQPATPAVPAPSGGGLLLKVEPLPRARDRGAGKATDDDGSDK